MSDIKNGQFELVDLEYCFNNYKLVFDFDRCILTKPLDLVFINDSYKYEERIREYENFGCIIKKDEFNTVVTIPCSIVFSIRPDDLDGGFMLDHRGDKIWIPANDSGTDICINVKPTEIGKKIIDYTIKRKHSINDLYGAIDDIQQIEQSFGVTLIPED